MRLHRHRRRAVQSYSPGGANVLSHVGTLVPSGEYDWIVIPSAHPSPSIQPFLYSSRPKVPMLYNGRPFPPKIAPSLGGIWIPI